MSDIKKEIEDFNKAVQDNWDEHDEKMCIATSEKNEEHQPTLETLAEMCVKKGYIYAVYMDNGKNHYICVSKDKEFWTEKQKTWQMAIAEAMEFLKERANEIHF